jgi:hypothetical protein
MHKQHPQRCIHSHICKFNVDNYEDCIDTDCASYIIRQSKPDDTTERMNKLTMWDCEDYYNFERVVDKLRQNNLEKVE